jgi:hypothetical protein
VAVVGGDDHERVRQVDAFERGVHRRGERLRCSELLDMTPIARS